MKKIDAILNYYQLGAITSLNEEDRKALFNIHKNQYESDSEAQEGEEQRMSQTIKSNHAKGRKHGQGENESAIYLGAQKTRAKTKKRTVSYN